MSSGQIIFLVVVAVLGIGGYTAYWIIKRKIEQISLAAFGTKSLVEGMNRQADVLAETPKSVAGMTRIFGPQIERDFPDFNLEQFKDKVENLLVTALTAVTQRNPEPLRNISQEVCNQVQNQIEGNRAAGTKEVYSQIRIHQTEITNYQKKDGKCIITFQSSVEYYHYKERDGSVIEGERERKKQTRYNTELMYIQDEKLVKTDNAVGTTCPNCGAPVTNLGNMRCEYCGLAVIPVNIKVWKLHQYYEVDYHHV